MTIGGGGWGGARGPVPYIHIVIRSSGPRNLPLTPEAAATHNQNHAGLTFLRDPSTTDAKCTKELLYLTYIHQQWHTDAS